MRAQGCSARHSSLAPRHPSFPAMRALPRHAAQAGVHTPPPSNPNRAVGPRPAPRRVTVAAQGDAGAGPADRRRLGSSDLEVSCELCLAWAWGAGGAMRGGCRPPPPADRASPAGYATRAAGACPPNRRANSLPHRQPFPQPVAWAP